MKRWLQRWFARPAGTSALTPELERRIRASFDEAAGDEEHFPSSIDPRIFHVRLMLRFFGNLSGRCVLDAGCGKGRFARVLRDEYPTASIVATDISEHMLRYVPPGIRSCLSTMTALPFAAASFDAAYATESLEHAVDIAGALAEICRVVKPGGRILIIDKNVEHWGKLKTPEWERWFDRREVETMLHRHCREVSSQLISYWEDVEPDGMFVAWLAVK